MDVTIIHDDAETLSRHGVLPCRQEVRRQAGIMPLTNNRTWRGCPATIYAKEKLME